MKKLLLSFILFAFCAIAFAQAPQKMSYQAMIRNNNNSLIINQTIGMRISIIQGTINGSVVYTERQTPTTNNIGLISIEIGSNPSGLNFNTINWTQGPYFIKTEIDPTGGNNYTINGAAELLSVPYALYADKANSITGILPISNGGTGASNLNDLKNNIGLNLKADLKSPSFYGTPVAPTPVLGTNNAQIATTAFVARSITKANVQPASSSVLGTIKLAGDLGGTADLPIILNDKITTNKIANNNVTNEKIVSLDANKITGILSVAKGGTGDTSVSGLKNLLKIDKIDNTADNDKPVSGLMLAALNLKLNKADTLLLNNRINSKLAKTDTASLSNRINSKLANTDTLGLSNRINTKLAKTDTASLSNRINTKAPINNPTFTGNVNGISASMVGLGNVNNTTDLLKPVSTATQTALNLKLNSTDTVGLSNRINTKLAKTDTAGLSNRINSKLAKTDTAGLSNRINTKAPINNPTFTGIVNGINSSMVGLGNVNNTADAAKPVSTATQTALNLKLNSTDTVGLSNRINTKLAKTDTAGLSNRINSKLAKTDTAGLSNRINTKAPINNPTFTGIVNGINSSMVGLGNVNNTTDAAKPVSTATQTALNLKLNSTDTLGLRNSIFTKLAKTDTLSLSNRINSKLAKTDTAGLSNRINSKLAKTDTAGLSNRINTKAPINNPTFTGIVNGISASMVGLGNLDNTSDAAKPVSTATQTALGLKLNATDTVGLRNSINTKLAKTDTAGLSNRINLKLAIADTLALSNRINTKLAKADTTSLSVRINQKLNISDTTSLRNGINARATIASPTFTGTPLAPTATAGTISNQIATTAFVQDAFTSFATSNGSSGSTLTGAIWTSATTGTLNGIGFTMTQSRGSSTSNWDMSTSDFTAAPLSATQNSGEISHGDDWVVTFASPISDLKLYCKYWRTASYVFSQPLTLLSSGNGLTSPNSTTVSVGANVWGNGIIQFAGPITNLTVNSSADLINDASGQILTFGVGSVGPTSGTGEIIRSANPTFTGTVSGITKAMVGLGSVDNTSDLDKPISTLTQTALDLKAPIANPTFTGTVSGITATMVGLNAVDNTSDLDKPISTATQTALDEKLTKTSTRVAIGYVAGYTNQGDYSVAIGSNAAQSGQGTQSVAVGFAANSGADYATSLGGFSAAGYLNSTAIGYQAVANAANTIQLGADGVTIPGSTAITNVKTSGTITAGTITYPNISGTANQVLTTDGSGTASWSTPVTQTASDSSTAIATTAFVQTALNTAFTNEVSDEPTASAGQTTFTLSKTPGTNSKVKMFINGIRISNTAYTISGTSLTYVPGNNGAYAIVVGDRIQFDFSY